jgi:hypothetical protein
MAGLAARGIVPCMDDVLQQIATIVIAGGATLVFALMAWAGQHHS